MKTGDRFIGMSIVGTEFHCRIDAEVSIGAQKGITPIITGSAWITGLHQHTLDPSDPLPAGYRLSDTWPMQSGQVG